MFCSLDTAAGMETVSSEIQGLLWGLQLACCLPKDRSQQPLSAIFLHEIKLWSIQHLMVVVQQPLRILNYKSYMDTLCLHMYVYVTVNGIYSWKPIIDISFIYQNAVFLREEYSILENGDW